MKSYFKLFAIVALYATIVYACKKSTTAQGPKPTGLEGVWGGKRMGGTTDSFSLTLKLGDSLSGTFKIGNVVPVGFEGVWQIVDTLFVANCIDTSAGSGGGKKTFSARVNRDSLNGSWFSSGGSSGTFKLKKIN